MGPLPLLGRHLPPWLRFRGEHPAVVRRPDCAPGLLDLCADVEGTSYGIVPFMNPKQLACTSALVGAGGNLGAVIALWGFYKPLGPTDTLLPFKVHGAYVIFWALTSPAFYWKDKGGMFSGATDPAFQKPVAAKGLDEAA